MGETITVLRPTDTEDRYHNVVQDWSDPERTDVEGCAVAPSSSSEDNANRQGVVAGLTVYAPADADIRHTDRVEVRGLVYEVDGTPNDWRSPFSGRRPGLEVALKRVEG